MCANMRALRFIPVYIPGHMALRSEGWGFKAWCRGIAEVGFNSRCEGFLFFILISALLCFISENIKFLGNRLFRFKLIFDSHRFTQYRIFLWIATIWHREVLKKFLSKAYFTVEHTPFNGFRTTGTHNRFCDALLFTKSLNGWYIAFFHWLNLLRDTLEF